MLLADGKFWFYCRKLPEIDETNLRLCSEIETLQQFAAGTRESHQSANAPVLFIGRTSVSVILTCHGYSLWMGIIGTF